MVAGESAIEAMKAFLKRYLLLMSCLLCLRGHAQAPIPGSLDNRGTDQLESPKPADLSSNWIVEAKAALPTNSAAEELSFRDLTNLVFEESQRGNAAAERSWGYALVVQSRSKADVSSGLQLLQDSAGKGCVPAMVSLGLLYEGDQYIERNYNEAFRWFSRAADSNNAAGQLELGVCYHNGRGTARDDAMAASLYRLSAAQGNYAAMRSFGYVLMNGRGVDKDLDQARYWLTRAAREGNNRRAMYDLGALCMRKFPDANATTEAFRWYRQSADLGDALACFQVAKFYYNGWAGVEINLDEYHHWLTRAATLGATQAQRLMGDAYRVGDWVSRDPEMSLEWYQKAATKNDPYAYYGMAIYYRGLTNDADLAIANEYMILAAQKGHREAQFQCAIDYFRGYGAPRDFEKGKEWLLKSAENGWDRAQYYLFELYYHGTAPAAGCPAYPRDRFEAVKWLRRAAEHEDFRAQSMLAVMLLKGQNVEQDRMGAERLLRHAAEHGYAQAQNDLGYAIESGDTTNRDPVEAAVWFQLAQSHATNSQTIQRAMVNFANAASKLSADEQAEVARRVREFRAVPVPPVDAMPRGWETNGDYQSEDVRFGH